MKEFKLNERDSNFELLRIVCMIFIIMHHFAVYGGYKIGSHKFFNDFVFSLLYSGGKLGVILFVMITGYYMIKIKKCHVRKLIQLEGQVLFYSIGLLLISVLFLGYQCELKKIFVYLFPNIFKVYWFFSGYFFLYLCIPYLNRLLLSITKKEFFRLLFIGFVFLILIPSIVIYNNNITETVYLFYYYMIGAFIRLYKNNIRGKYIYLFVFMFFYLAISFLTIFLSYLSMYNEYLVELIYSFSRISSVLMFVCCICLFLFFLKVSISKIKIINFLSSLSFGVYLFHEHPFIRNLLWQRVFPAYRVINFSLISVVGIAFIVYFIGGVFEIVRKYFFDVVKKYIKIRCLIDFLDRF